MKAKPYTSAYWLLIVVGLIGTCSSQTQPSPAPAGSVQRVLVKVRAPLAAELEADLPLQEMAIAAGRSRNVRVQGFMNKHAVRRLAPIYPKLVRAKKVEGLTDDQLAARVRQRFSKRASRVRNVAAPPEISRTYLLELNGASPSDLKRALDELNADADVEFAEPDRVVSVKQAVNDPYLSSTGTWGQSYPDLWGILKIGAPSIWGLNAGDGIVVAVVDTGIDYNHPDIAANMWVNTKEIAGNGIDDDGNGFVDDTLGWDFIGSSYQNPTQSNDPIDHFGHGTHVAGTIAAVGNNGIGVIGVAWRAKVMAVKGLDDSGNGLESTLSNSIIYAANNGADVINNSWGGQGSSQIIADAVNYAYSLGAVVIAAAGNNNEDARNFFPANLEQVITVAATDSNDFKASFSNWGSKIDVAAPGVDILSLRAAGTTLGTPVDLNYTRADGTSMATPHVSGLAALILSQHPAYTNEDVRQVLRVSGTDIGLAGYDLDSGYGRINAAAALAVPNVLEARIQSPADGAHLNGVTTVSGVARGNGFMQYKLEYGNGYLPTSWILLASGSVPVANAVLGVFDPSGLPDGVYTLRLTATDASGTSFMDRISVLTDYVSISSPIAPAVPVTASVFKPGSPITITGTATGPSFSDYRIEWAEGINPATGWSSAGMSLSNGGLAPLTAATLGTWDTSAITSADYYSIRVTVDDAGFVSQAMTLVYLEPSLLSANWPKWLSQAPWFSSGVVPAVDAGGKTRLTLVSPVYLNTPLSAQFWSFSADGATQSITPLVFGDYFQPAAGDIDGLPGEETVVEEANSLRDFFADNTSSVLDPGFHVNFQNSQVVLEDLDGDQQLETLAIGKTQVNTAFVFAWTRGGTQLNANFPIQILDQDSQLGSVSGSSPRLLVGDIDGDGRKEILVQEGDSSSTFRLRLFANDGTPRPFASPEFTGYADQMALADLDHNGKLETLLLCNSGSDKVMHVLQPDGTERAGWPVVLARTNSSYLAVGDLNRDGHEEIVISNFTTLYVFAANGTPFSSAWPRIENQFGINALGPVVLADINGDGYPEILVTRDESFLSPSPLLPTSASSSVNSEAVSSEAVNTESGKGAFTVETIANPDGTFGTQIRTDVSTQAFPSNSYDEPKLIALDRNNNIVQSWRMLGANGNQPFYQSRLTVGDFNSDGLTDIAATYYTISGGGVSGFLNEGVVTVLSTGAPLNTAANDWPMLFQNPRNTALLQRDPNRPSVSLTAPLSGATLQATVTLTATVSDDQPITGIQFQLDDSPLGPQVTAPPYTMQWDTSAVVPGNHTLRAAIHDSANRVILSPPVNVTVAVSVVATLAPSALQFGSVPLNTVSAAQTVTVTNVGVLPVSSLAVSVTGHFSQTNNCGVLLAVNSSCTVNVVYAPTLAGNETGTLTLGGNFVIPPAPVALSGFGDGPLATLTPASLTFPGQIPNTTSTAQALTYLNTGDVPVAISSISVTGDFSQTNDCPASLAVATSCTVSVTFTPVQIGSRTGSVSIAGSVPAAANLSGTGQTDLFAPLSLDFGRVNAGTTSPVQFVSIVNSSAVSFFINGWSFGSPFQVVNNCPFTIAPGTSCRFSVSFAPTGSGTYSNTLTITGSFPGSSASISLAGTGVSNSSLLIPGSTDFGNQAVNSSSFAKQVTLFNTGNKVLNISAIQTSGDFSQTNNCGASLAANTACTINVTFKPTARGARTGTLSVLGDFTQSAPTATLTGTGVAAIGNFTPASLTFADQPVGTASASQPVILSNTGDVALTVSTITISPDFTQTNNCGASLAPATSCTLNVTFLPTAVGSRSGSLTLASNSSTPVAPVTLSGNATAPVAILAPVSLSFVGQVLATSSAAQAIALSNTGNAPLSITSIATTGDFTQTNTCGTSLAAGASCAINVTFTPAATGARGGSLTLISNSNVGVSPVTLAGTGIAPLASLSPASLRFANQRVGGSSVAQVVTLSNSGTAPLTINSVGITGDFTQTNTCGTSLATGASCAISITFNPIAGGMRTGTLSVGDNSTGGAVQTTGLTGTGIDFSLSASPATATVNAGKTASYTVTAGSVGGSFNSAITLNCLGLPTGATCTFSPISVTPGSTPVKSSLRISTTQRGRPTATPPGTYTVTITGTSSTVQHLTSVRLTVN